MNNPTIYSFILHNEHNKQQQKLNESKCSSYSRGRIPVCCFSNLSFSLLFMSMCFQCLYGLC